MNDSPLPKNAKLCTGMWTGTVCSRREHCARYLALKDADRLARVFSSLCPGLDDYWPHYIRVEVAK